MGQAIRVREMSEEGVVGWRDERGEKVGVGVEVNFGDGRGFCGVRARGTRASGQIG